MEKKKREVRIDKEGCKGCMLCIHVCPQHALAVAKDVNKKGLQYIVMEHPEKCTGCGLCYTMCPDCGIEIIEKEETKKKK